MRNFGGGGSYHPYFCVSKYARAVEQKVWNEAENREREWRKTLASHARASLAWDLRHALPICLLILRKKRLFCSLTLFVNSKKLNCESNSFQREVGKAGFPIP